MKNYTITVNGNVYDVTVEEGSSVQAQAPVKKQAVTKAAPAPTAAKAAPAAAAGTQGAVKINASVPGKVFKVEASIGQTVKAGDTLMILEAMKMEIPVVAPQDGTIASIDVTAGSMVESGDALASLN